MHWSKNFPRSMLLDNEIHVYCAHLDEMNVDALLLLLSDDERARAERFHFDIDRRRFIARRGQLRLLLSRYLDVLPAQIAFAYSAHGKSYLPNQALHFNLSDAKPLALYAFARVPIGIDIEHIYTMSDMDDVAALMFSQAENAVYRALPDEQKAEGFFNCWTRKEAFIKAVGEGLSYPLADFDVTLKPGDSAKILRIRENTQAYQAWSLYDLQPAADFCGALAIQGRGWHVSCYSLTGG